MAEIADGCDLVGGPLQQHEIFWPQRRLAGIEHQDRRTVFHQPGHQVPVPRLRIISEISDNFGLAVQARVAKKTPQSQ